MSQPQVPFVPMREDLVIFGNENPWRHRFIPQSWGFHLVRRQHMHLDVAIRQQGATARMQFRASEGAPGAPLVTATVAIDDWLYAAITQADIATLRAAANGTDQLRIPYDLLVTIPNVGENVCFFGEVEIKPGVTR